MNEKKSLTTRETFELAVRNHQKNNLQVAHNLYKEILKKNPNHFGSNFLLGTLSAQIKKFDMAKQLLQKTIQIQPDNADAYNNLGNVQRELGEYQKANTCFEKAIQINPNFAQAYNNHGIALNELGEFQKAISCYQKAIQIQPDYADAHNNLGITLNELGEFQKAISCYQKAIQIRPDYAYAYNNLGNALKRLEEFQKAADYYKKAIKIKPNYTDAHKNLMQIFEKTNQEKELKNAILNAQNLIKDNSVIKLYEGILLFRNEKYYEAINCLKKISFDSAGANLNKESSRVLTLAKCYDRTGNFDEAFNYFSKANNFFLLQEKVKKFDKNKYLEDINKRIKFFKKLEVNKWSNFKPFDKKPDPVFLIGFPRSGTTLLDTILRSHSMIEVLEEKNIVANLINSLNEISPHGLEDLKNLRINQIEKLRNDYFTFRESIVQNKNNSKLYIDKLPLNIIHVGEIVRIFPGSKFILSLRHPCDCVLSCFMQDFKLNNAMANFLNLHDSAHLYDAVMNLWIRYLSIFSINYHEVKYENLVENFKVTVQSVLKFLEIPWEDSVMDYLKTARNRDRINTPSYNQVTKSLYTHAKGRWKHYKKQTLNIYPILEYWIKKFDY
jgi:tetratricopeptide (TPR) repeat protein